jgi:eukaryotic translation initiation factor 2C
VQAKNVQRTSAQTLSNLCLKVNAKLGGTNNIVLPSNRPRMFNEPLMIMGVSLSHPPPGDPRKPTITAVSVRACTCIHAYAQISASMDAHPWRYAAAVRVQFAERTVDSENGRMREVRPDTVMHMKTMVKQLLLSFYTATRFKPARLIFYRDSILPAQFAHVLRVEMRAIREACTSLETDYQPAITYIAVTKRHHTRFFCGDKRDMVCACGTYAV